MAAAVANNAAFAALEDHLSWVFPRHLRSVGDVDSHGVVLAGTKDKDATVRVKALGIVGCIAAEAALSDTSQEKLVLMLTQR